MLDSRKDVNMGNWNLYVLRYDCTGNYYVGITEGFEKRMLVHLLRTSTKNNLPKFSAINKSTKGFKCYWFHVTYDVEQGKADCYGVERGEADRCESLLAEKITNKIIDLYAKDPNKKRKIFVGHGGDIEQIANADKLPDDLVDNEIEKMTKFDNSSEDDDFDIEIKKMLNSSTPIKLDDKKSSKKFSIKCFEIAHVNEFQDSEHNANWIDIREIEYSQDEKTGVTT